MKKHREWLVEQVWLVPPRLSRFNDKIIYFLRLLWIVCRGFMEDHCLLRAQALAYTTMVSLVPLLVVGFSVLKGMLDLKEARARLEPILSEFLIPESQDTISEAIFSFIGNIDAKAIGVVAFLFLILSVLSLMATIEKTFNAIWGVTISRDFFEKIKSYIAILFFGPILLIISMSLSASMQSSAFYTMLTKFPVMAMLLGAFFAYFANVGAFFLLYLYMPNIKVRVVPALVGALFASILFELAKQGYAIYVSSVMSAENPVTQIYGGFISLPIFLLWIWLLWLIVLIGAEASFACQNLKNFEFEGRSTHSNFNSHIFTGLLLCAESAKQFYGEDRIWDREKLAELYNIPVRLINEVATQLIDGGLLVAGGSGHENERKLVPAIDPQQITVLKIYRVLSASGFEATVGCDAKLVSAIQALLNQPQTTLAEFSHNLKPVQMASNTANP